MDVKKALEEAAGDLTVAADVLRKNGVAKAAKKADRETHEGRIHSYIHSNGKLGALVEVSCETDFVARTDAFVAFCNDLAMHVCASDPLYLSRESVPAEVLEKEQQIYREEMAGAGKTPEVVEKIIEGKVNKWMSEVVLFEQPFVKDDTKTVDDLLKETIAALGENMQIRRFVRYSIA